MENVAKEPSKTKIKGLSGSTLKWIAIITMLIDHIGAVVVNKLILLQGVDMMTMSFDVKISEDTAKLIVVYAIMRMIGRIAFPIFCFLLVQGFVHTHNVKKYILRLAAFTLISEIPFDLAFKGRLFYWGYNNVFFTLLFGVLVMLGMQQIDGKIKWTRSLKVALKILVTGLAMALAVVCHTDYSWIGVLCITLLYITRNNKVKQIVVGCMSFAFEFVAPLAFIPIGFYNGKRGMNMKYFFYIFYPAHLLILYGITFIL